MRTPLPFLDRFLPTLLMVSSITLLGAGLLAYAPSTYGEWRTPEPQLGDPRLGAAGDATPDPGPSAHATATPLPLTTAAPGPEPTPRTGPVATRIRIPSLRVDLPVIAGDLEVPGNVDFYPLCDVAMYLPGFVQPGEEGTTYIYAHAQKGMFAPLLKQSQLRDGASMVGSLVEVYTSDNKLHLYELYRVKRHATDLSLADAPPGEQLLVLQTSEGVAGTVPKLQVAARPVSVVDVGEAEANPEAKPRVCLPD